MKENRTTHRGRMKSSEHDTLKRRWDLLRSIPRGPRKITASELHTILGGLGHDISSRSIERDLNTLSGIFPLVVDDRSKPFGWSWKKDAPVFDLPGLSDHEALTLILAEKHLAHLLPSSTLLQLRSHFRAAHDSLESSRKSGRIGKWINKVRAVPPSLPLIPPIILPAIYQAVSEALLAERQLKITYTTRDGNTVDYRLHPLALIQRGPVLYLHCRLFDYEDTRSLVMHRIKKAVEIDAPAVSTDGYDIDQEIKRGAFQFNTGHPEAVRLLFTKEAGSHLYETPLTKDQTIEVAPDGRLIVTASLVDTPQLRWWILGLGTGVVVEKPAGLRVAISETVRQVALAYSTHSKEKSD